MEKEDSASCFLVLPGGSQSPFSLHVCPFFPSLSPLPLCVEKQQHKPCRHNDMIFNFGLITPKLYDLGLTT